MRHPFCMSSPPSIKLNIIRSVLLSLSESWGESPICSEPNLLEKDTSINQQSTWRRGHASICLQALFWFGCGTELPSLASLGWLLYPVQPGQTQLAWPAWADYCTLSSSTRVRIKKTWPRIGFRIKNVSKIDPVSKDSLPYQKRIKKCPIRIKNVSIRINTYQQLNFATHFTYQKI